MSDDPLPLGEVSIRGEASPASGLVYYFWTIAGSPESVVGYLDPEVARRRGAEELRRRRQIAAMRRP